MLQATRVYRGKRGTIVGLLAEQPGLSQKALGIALRTHASSVRYHLHVLARAQVVIREGSGRSARFFLNGTMTPRDRRLSMLGDVERAMLAELLATPGWQRCCDLAARIGVSRSRARCALRTLERAGLANRSAYAKWEAASPRQATTPEGARA